MKLHKRQGQEALHWSLHLRGDLLLLLKGAVGQVSDWILESGLQWPEDSGRRLKGGSHYLGAVRGGKRTLPKLILHPW